LSYHDVSWPVVAAAFTAHAAVALPAKPQLPAVLGIDEVGGPGLLGQVEGRIAAVVVDWHPP